MRGSYVIILVVAVSLFFGINSVFAQIQNSIVVTTDKSFYSEGETILITGEVRDLYSGTPVSVIVISPTGDLVSLAQVTVGADKKFSTEMIAGGALMRVNGTYVVKAQYGTDSRSISTTFEFGSYFAPQISSPKIVSNEIGSANLEQSVYSIGRTDDTLVKVFGNISNPLKGSRVTITLTTPEFDSDGQLVFPTDKGNYEAYFPFDYYSPTGTYEVLVSYSSSIIGRMTFDVTHEPIQTNNLPQKIIQSVKQNHISIPSGTSVPGCEESFSCYLPFSVIINAGDTITWSNDDSAIHTVTSGSPADGPSGVFDTGLLMADSTFSVTLDAPGSYDYFCMVHPWMAGTIDVINSGTKWDYSSFEPEIVVESNPEPLQIPAPFVDTSKDPQHYVDRYNNELSYKEWFDKNYPQYSSIYEAVGVDESSTTGQYTLEEALELQRQRIESAEANSEMDPESISVSEIKDTPKKKILE